MAQLITALSSNSYKASSDCPDSEFRASPAYRIKKLHIRGKHLSHGKMTRSVMLPDLRREKVEVSGNVTTASERR